MMLYASFTEGYKSGFIADQIAPSPAAPNGGVIPFNHENVETFELGLQLAATENLRFDASVGKLNHEIVRLDPSVAFKTDGGMPRSPEDSWKIGVRYDVPLGNGGKLRFGLDHGFTTKLLRSGSCSHWKTLSHSAQISRLCITVQETTGENSFEAVSQRSSSIARISRNSGDWPFPHDGEARRIQPAIARVSQTDRAVVESTAGSSR